MPRTPSDIKSADLPLHSLTPARWAAIPLSDPMALLNDHAHLEKKAAANALDLVHRYPEPARSDLDPANAASSTSRSKRRDLEAYHDRWVKTLAVIAREESEHLALVVRILQRRGGQLSRQHRNPYASDLRKQVRMGQGPRELLDRLMVSALIEIRSCERFGVLAEQCEDEELSNLYRGLYASELGHYHVFIELAQGVPGIEDVDTTWDDWLQREALILASQPVGPGIHTGVPEESSDHASGSQRNDREGPGGVL